MICPRCTKNTDGVHTCTPTDEWRKLEAENAALWKAVDLASVVMKVHSRPPRLKLFQAAIDAAKGGAM